MYYSVSSIRCIPHLVINVPIFGEMYVAWEGVFNVLFILYYVYHPIPALQPPTNTSAFLSTHPVQ